MDGWMDGLMDGWMDVLDYMDGEREEGRLGNGCVRERALEGYRRGEREREREREREIGRAWAARWRRRQSWWGSWAKPPPRCVLCLIS
jgi:hypothetical protein